MIKTIYSLEPECFTYKNCGVCKAVLHFQGKRYSGVSQIAPEDEDFFSEKVGLNIALSRARIKILKDMTLKAKIVADTKYQMYQEAGEYGRLTGVEIDPTGNFWVKVIKAQKNYERLRKALSIEKKYLNEYLINQDKMIERVRLYRAQVKNK